jgi:hypothetical protein
MEGEVDSRDPSRKMKVACVFRLKIQPGILGQWPNFRGSICQVWLLTPTKERSSGEGQRKEVYSVAWDTWQEEASKHMSLSPGCRHEL